MFLTHFIFTQTNALKILSLPIFFVPHLSAEKVFVLPEDTSRHVVQVLRMKTTEKLQLSDGAGTLTTAEIIDSNKRNCLVSVIKVQEIKQPKQQVCVAISLLKNINRFEWFLEKVTEIGVTEIIPLLCDRTEKEHFRYERMQQIIISAMLQSKQSWLPKLHFASSFTNVIQSSPYEDKLIAHCLMDDKAKISEYAHKPSIQILIGPEGDFTNQEITEALQLGFKPVALGNTRLRTETAGVVAASVLCV